MKPWWAFNKDGHAIITSTGWTLAGYWLWGELDFDDRERQDLLYDVFNKQFIWEQLWAIKQGLG